jgi:hypothetical protein
MDFEEIVELTFMAWAALCLAIIAVEVVRIRRHVLKGARETEAGR